MIQLLIKSFFLFIIILSTLSFTHANDLMFIWEEDKTWFSSDDKEKVQNSIHSIQDTYWLNMDIIILGPNDKKWCYNEVGIDLCVKNNYVRFEPICLSVAYDDSCHYWWE